MNEFKTRPEEAAYPILNEQFGLTKREYFAAIAMQGILSNPDRNWNSYDICRDSVHIADVLIETLSR